MRSIPEAPKATYRVPAKNDTVRLSVNFDRATHSSYGGEKGLTVLLMMKGGTYGPPNRHTDSQGHEWWTWPYFPAEVLDGAVATFKRIGIPDTAIVVRS